MINPHHQVIRIGIIELHQKCASEAPVSWISNTWIFHGGSRVGKEISNSGCASSLRGPAMDRWNASCGAIREAARARHSHMQQWKRPPCVVCLGSAEHLEANRLVEIDGIGVLFVYINKQSVFQTTGMRDKHPSSSLAEVIGMKKERLQFVLGKARKTDDRISFEQNPQLKRRQGMVSHQRKESLYFLLGKKGVRDANRGQPYRQQTFVVGSLCRSYRQSLSHCIARLVDEAFCYALCADHRRHSGTCRIGFSVFCRPFLQCVWKSADISRNKPRRYREVGLIVLCESGTCSHTGHYGREYYWCQESPAPLQNSDAITGAIWPAAASHDNRRGR